MEVLDRDRVNFLLEFTFGLYCTLGDWNTPYFATKQKQEKKEKEKDDEQTNEQASE